MAETPAAVNTQITPANTLPSPTSVPSIVPSFTPTTEIPCDPFSVDFCITEGHFLLQRPIQPPGNDLIDATYRYGSTANGTRDPHHGVEFVNPSGTPVHAGAEGMVIFAGSDKEAIYAPWGNFYGNLVVIEHDDLFTLYAHLSRVDVEAGQKVFAGDKIGEVGWTGGAIGSHLHFEVRHGNVEDYFATQNPELWLVPARDVNGDPFGTLMISVGDEGNALFKNANFTIGYYPELSQSPVKLYYGTTYSSDMFLGDENAALGELSAGRYRIAVEMNGQIHERWVEVESGKLTQVVFAVN
ncbi:MAG TPA: M23 family metallopeptidase [Anaerolineales bacterium]|nr:M23 family metallopeptidase [Anaerolineales bacterium]